MVDVAYNASNLWFAGEKKNWLLANYFLGETRNRMQWEVRLNPGPKGPTGEIVDMKGTVDGINNGSLAEIKKAIDAKDVTAFETGYKHMLEDCYSCHKNANRAYMRPDDSDRAAANHHQLRSGRHLAGVSRTALD
jgi:hypothetical protein